jgi:hypothetical protein
LTTHHEGISTHPVYGAPVSGGVPKTSDDGATVFRLYRVAISQYAWISDDHRIMIRGPDEYARTYRVTVDGMMAPTKFRAMRTAIAAAIKMTKDLDLIR